MKEKSIKLNMILNMFRSLMSVIYPLITFPYASRILNPEGIGKVDFANSTVSLFSIIASLGIGTYAMREGAKIRENKVAFNKFISEVFVIHAISTIVAYVLFFITIYFVPKYHDYKTLLLICSSSLFLYLLSFDYVFTSTENYLFITLRSLIFQIIGILALLMFVKKSEDYIKYCIIGITTASGPYVLNLFYSRKLFKFKKIKFIDLKKHLKPIFILFSVSIAASVYSLLDQNMLGLLSNDFEVGIYNAAIKVIRIVIPFLAAMTSVMVPRMSYYIEQDRERYNQMLQKSINLIFLIAVPSSVGLFVMAKPIILIICGDQFIKSIPAMQLMCPIVFFILCGGLLGDQIFTPLRKDKLNLYPVIFGALINIILNFIFIPKFGAYGAALGTLAAESTVNIFKMIFAIPYTRGKKLFNEIWKYFIGSILMFITLYIFNYYITSSFLQLLIGIPIGILVYFVILYVLKSNFLYLILEYLYLKLKKNN